MSRFLAATLGRIAPGYRTLAQWDDVYQQLISARPIGPKTIANRRSSRRRLLAALGNRCISRIRPHEVAALVHRTHGDHPHAAKRLLQEAREMFSEAVNYGWIDRNPATTIKQLPVRVQRRRLTLEQWQQIHDYAAENMPPWVPRLLVLALVTGQRRSDLQKMRFDDVWDDHLHVIQAKTATRLALPVALRLDAIDTSIAEAIESCRGYAVGDVWMVRKHSGRALGMASLSARFEEAREGALGLHDGHGAPASLHECRSLAERLYRAQGVDTRVLLGHKHQAMTDMYHDDRGLSADQWQRLTI